VQAVRRLVSPLGRLFKRGDGRSPGDTGDRAQDTPTAPPGKELTVAAVGEGQEMAVGDEGQGPVFRRWAKRARGMLNRTLRRPERTPEQPEDTEETEGQEAVLLFAYHPEIVPLHDSEGAAHLPDRLIPLCSLRYSQRLRPEAVETAQAFSKTGVGIKVFTSDDPDHTVAMLRQAGLDKGVEEQLLDLGTVSGRDLGQLTPDQWVHAAAENTIFGHIAPEQAGALVQALRDGGESVAVVGDGVADLPALQQANLAICRQTSTQAALSVADIVLLGNSPEVLLKVLEKGQRIVHGLLEHGHGMVRIV